MVKYRCYRKIIVLLERVFYMAERKELYLKLQKQLNSILPFIGGIVRSNEGVKIGNVIVSYDAFSKMEKEFSRIVDTPYSEEAVKCIKGDIIPLGLITTNVFFKEIQISLNQLKQERLFGNEDGR